MNAEEAFEMGRAAWIAQRPPEPPPEFKGTYRLCWLDGYRKERDKAHALAVKRDEAGS